MFLRYFGSSVRFWIQFSNVHFMTLCVQRHYLTARWPLGVWRDPSNALNSLHFMLDLLLDTDPNQIRSEATLSWKQKSNSSFYCWFSISFLFCFRLKSTHIYCTKFEKHPCLPSNLEALVWLISLNINSFIIRIAQILSNWIQIDVKLSLFWNWIQKL